MRNRFLKQEGEGTMTQAEDSSRVPTKWLFIPVSNLAANIHLNVPGHHAAEVGLRG
jgi:hypothetical protein